MSRREDGVNDMRPTEPDAIRVPVSSRARLRASDAHCASASCHEGGSGGIDLAGRIFALEGVIWLGRERLRRSDGEVGPRPFGLPVMDFRAVLCPSVALSTSHKRVT